MAHKHSTVETILVQRGLLTAEALEQALRLKTRQGGSLAVNLVITGAIDDLSLCSFYEDRYRLSRVEEGELAAVNREVFGLIPVEIIYDAGVFPLRLEGGERQRLVVGLIDPSEPDALEEASFFSGLDMAPRLLTIGQMARHYLRLTGKRWKVDWETVKARRRIHEARQQARREATQVEVALAPPVAELLEQTQSLDASLQSLLSGEGASREDVLIAVVSVDEDERQEGVIELTRRKATSVSIVDTTRLSVEEAEQRLEALIQQADPSLSRSLGVREAVADVAPADEALERLMEEADTSWMEAREERAEEAPISLHEGDIKAVAASPGAQLTSFHEEEAASADIGLVFQLDDLSLAQAPPGPLQADLGELAVAVDRDAVGLIAARFLRRFYKRVLLMTLRGSLASPWVRALEAGPEVVSEGSMLQLQEYLALRRVTRESTCYLGPIMRSQESAQAAHALKELLGGGLPLSAVVCPLFLKDRMIAFFYCDEGPRQAVALDRASLTLLRHHLEAALLRIILLRKQRES